MITNGDLAKIIEALKEFFYSKEEMEEKFSSISEEFSTLQSSVDLLSKEFKDQNDELKIVSSKVTNLDNFARKAALKVNVEYETH